MAETFREFYMRKTGLRWDERIGTPFGRVAGALADWADALAAGITVTPSPEAESTSTDNDIIVTPEMIRVGLIEYRAHDAAMERPQDFLTDLYRAMAAKAPTSVSMSFLSPQDGQALMERNNELLAEVNRLVQANQALTVRLAPPATLPDPASC